VVGFRAGLWTWPKPETEQAAAINTVASCILPFNVHSVNKMLGPPISVAGKECIPFHPRRAGRRSRVDGLTVELTSVRVVSKVLDIHRMRV